MVRKVCAFVQLGIVFGECASYDRRVLLDKLLANLAVDVEPFALCLLSAGWRLALPAPANVTIHFVLEGHGAVRGPDGVAHAVAPFWLIVVPARTKHVLESGEDPERERRLEALPEAQPAIRIVAGAADDPSLTVACGTVRVRYGSSLGLFDHLHEVLAVDLSVFPDARLAIEGILAEQARPSPGGSAMTAALMTQCLVYLFRQLYGRPQSLPWLSALEDPRLARAIDRILEDPGANHTVESLADTASMSRSAFAERFTVAFERSPMSLVQHVRMQRAYQLLRQRGSLSIDEVAGCVGYSSRSHFSRAFKKHHGISPTACRAASQNVRGQPIGDPSGL